MTSGDEVISDLVSDNEYSYEENEKKSKPRIKKGNRDANLGKKKREDNTDELISDDMDDNQNSLNGYTDSNQYMSNSLTKKRKRVRRSKGRRHGNEDSVREEARLYIATLMIRPSLMMKITLSKTIVMTWKYPKSSKRLIWNTTVPVKDRRISSIGWLTRTQKLLRSNLMRLL